MIIITKKHIMSLLIGPNHNGSIYTSQNPQQKLPIRFSGVPRFQLFKYVIGTSPDTCLRDEIESLYKQNFGKTALDKAFELVRRGSENIRVTFGLDTGGLFVLITSKLSRMFPGIPVPGSRLEHFVPRDKPLCTAVINALERAETSQNFSITWLNRKVTKKRA